MSSKGARSEATRAALVGAARRLFGERGFAGVGTEEIVRSAGVTRGALYHHFADKTDLFRAVYEQVEGELTERIATVALGGEDPIEAMRLARHVFLEACSDPELERIALLEAPSVIGWEEWRAIGARHGLGMIEAALRAAMDMGRMRPVPVRPLAHVILGALDEGALLVARSDDPERARSEVGEALDRLFDGLILEPA